MEKDLCCSEFVGSIKSFGLPPRAGTSNNRVGTKELKTIDWPSGSRVDFQPSIFSNRQAVRGSISADLFCREAQRNLLSVLK